ncbi:restriction endonuclease subunit S [Spirulina subsalsa]|uniref:restriction endonuclease subunit S n=1 Tax=Spirulina subsalsa TaxID=54311 RepID=UPI0002D63B1A|nr:restriction endonuclease subunit S [Spirulina subsalsa]
MSVEGWEIKKIDELALVDQETLSESTDKNFCFYYIDIGSIIEGNLLIPSNTITFKEAPSRARKRVYFSDVLMSTVRPNLKSFVYFDRTDNNYIASTGFAVLSAKDGVDPRFILYSILSDKITAQIESYIVGSNYPAINSNDVRNLQVLTPPFVEQQQIANILSTVDRAIAQTEALIAKQQRIKAGLMQDLLTKGIDENGNIRSEETHEFKDSAIGRIPVEWEVKQVVDVLLTSPKNGYSPQEVDSWQGIYTLGLGCLTFNGFRATHLKNAPANDSNVAKAILNDGDFLISRSNTREFVGLVGIYRNVGHPCIYPDLMIRLQFDDSVDNRYMQYILGGEKLRRQIQNAATGTSESMVKINSSVVQKLYFSKPKLEEQYRMLKILEKYSESIEIFRQQSEKLKVKKTGLMQDLLTGKVRVTPLLDNSGGIDS